MSRRSGRVAALQEREELLALQKRLEAEEKAEEEADHDAAFVFTRVEEVDVEEVEVIDAPQPSSKLLNRRIQLPVRKKTAVEVTVKSSPAASSATAVVLTAQSTEVVEGEVEEVEEEEEEEKEEMEDEPDTGDDDEDYKQTTKGPGKKKRTKATAKAASTKSKSPRVPTKRRKREKENAVVANGAADDPIELSDDDGGETAPEKKKKPARPKKAKAVPLIDAIRHVPTAQPNTRKLIGAHVSAGGGVQYAPHNAVRLFHHSLHPPVSFLSPRPPCCSLTGHCAVAVCRRRWARGVLRWTRGASGGGSLLPTPRRPSPPSTPPARTTATTLALSSCPMARTCRTSAPSPTASTPRAACA